MGIRVLAILAMTIILALLPSCQYVEPPPDMLAEEFHTGAVSGCLRIIVWQFGPVPEPDRAMVMELCEAMADEADQIRAEVLAENGRLHLPPPTPTATAEYVRPPGSEL